jgi:hypothetical protein
MTLQNILHTCSLQLFVHTTRTLGSVSTQNLPKSPSHFKGTNNFGNQSALYLFKLKPWYPARKCSRLPHQLQNNLQYASETFNSATLSLYLTQKYQPEDRSSLTEHLRPNWRTKPSEAVEENANGQ